MRKIDVIIPCHNYGRFLEASVSSALCQDGVDVRVVVIDDASTDQSLRVAEQLAAQDSRVHVIALTANVGMIRAVNLGLRDLRGDYFVKLDADDLLTPGSLKRSAELLDRHSDVGFVYGRPRLFRGERPPRPYPGWPLWRIWPGDEWVAMRYRRAVNCITQPEAMIRSTTLRAVGEYNPKLPHTSDLEMWLRLASVADVGRINGVVQGFYRIHPNSMQRTVNSGALTDLVGRREAFLSALSTMDRPQEEKADLEARMRRRLAEMALDHVCWTYERDRADACLTRDLLKFAAATWSAAETLPVWRSAELWRARGRRSRWAPGSLLSASRRRGLSELAVLRWMMTGL